MPESPREYARRSTALHALTTIMLATLREARELLDDDEMRALAATVARQLPSRLNLHRVRALAGRVADVELRREIAWELDALEEGRGS